MDLLINGVYDGQTLKTLQQLNINRIGFDLRGKSINLIPFHILKALIPQFTGHKNYLIFEDDKYSTISSFLDLLGKDKDKFELEFRDSLSPSFYSMIDHPFSWFFNPQSDWQNILTLQRLRTVILPLKYKQIYQSHPKIWDIIQARSLEVIIHVETFSDPELSLREKNLTLSVDLGKEMEIGFRQIDQSRLSNLKIWRTKNEATAGQ